MRRFLQLSCLAFVLIASILPISVTAQTVNSFQLVSTANSVDTGDYVSVTVEGKSLSDIYGAEIELAYDASKLKYKGYSSSLTGKAFVMEPTVKDGKILLVYTFMGSSPELNGDADLFTLSFQAIGTGDTSVRLNSLNALNRQGQTVAATLGSNVNLAISTNTTQPNNPLPTKDPDPIATPGVVPVEVPLNENGVISINVTPKDLLTAAESSTNKSVVILVNKASDAKEVQVNLPIAEWLQAAQTSNIDTIKIQSDLATVTIDTKLLSSTMVSGSSKLQFTMFKVDPASLPSAITNITGDSVVYDFTLSLDGQNIAQFTNNEVTVELPYTLAQGKNPSQVVIYYIAADGKLEVVKNGRYNAATGNVEFKPSHFSQYTAYHVPVSFQDMNGYGWANEAVLGLAAREVIQGRSEGHYVPEGQVTRAEFVQILTALFDLGDSNANTAFTDVEPGAWYYNAIASAQKAGLVQGKGDGSFGVNDRISREDMAVLIYRLAQKLGVTTFITSGGTNGSSKGFLDSGQTSVYAQEAVIALQQAGLMNGVTEGYFEPKGNSTRAQAASVLFRLYQVIQ